MFDELSDRWLAILKGWIQLEFGITILSGLFLGLIEDLAIVETSAFLNSLLWALIGVAAAFAALVINMLILQALTNLQLTRKAAENLASAPFKIGREPRDELYFGIKLPDPRADAVEERETDKLS